MTRQLTSLLFIGLIAYSKAQSYDDQDAIDSALLPVEHRGGFGPELGGGQNFQDYGGQAGLTSDPWPLTQNRDDMPTIKNIQVQCEKSFMRVSVEFDRPFYGMIFSKGYYSDNSCVHLQPDSGQLQAQFDIYLNRCGMSTSGGNNHGQPTPGGSFIENTVIIQYDPLVQEVWDAARKLRCTWYDYYEKSVTFKPFQVDMLNAVTANFLGDNLQCWMQIQVGKGPWASEVSGIVKIGQTMTMVLAIKDDENKFDMMVRNCVAHDGKRAPIQLVDQNGCITRPKIMGRFQKIKNFGDSASVVSYAYFQAFKFPDSMNVHFQCVIQVCRYQCPEPDCGGFGRGGNSIPYASGSENIPVRGPSTLPDPRQAGSHISANSVGRKGEELPDELDELPVPVSLQQLQNSDSSLPGRPRSINVNDLEKLNGNKVSERKRRSIVKRGVQEMKDISTERIIQVVAPGDLAFNLNNANETVVIASSMGDGSQICLTTTGFSVGLIILLLAMTISLIIASFMYSRVRAFNSKTGLTTYVHGYDNPEFVKGGVPVL